MKIRSEEYFRLFEFGEYPAFCCDSSFKIVATNSFFDETGFSFSIGEDIRRAMNSIKDASLFSDALIKLSAGLPLFSTDFDVFRHKPIFVLPIEFADPVSSGYLFVLFFESIRELPPIQLAMPGVVDRYRSPIFDILNVAQALSHRFESAEDYVGIDYLNHIMRCCYGMLRTTASVQTYFKLVNGRQRFEKETTMFKKHIEEISKTLSLLFTTSNHKLAFDICTEDAPVTLDTELFNLAFFHIVANACLFSPACSEVRISIFYEETSFRVVVSDDGDGVSASNMERIFEPFFTHHSSPVPEEQMGIGLGLPITKKIIEEHGGTVFVKSAPHKGTDIIIRIPVADDTTEPLTLNSNSSKYVTNRLSNAKLIFSDICNINL